MSVFIIVTPNFYYNLIMNNYYTYFFIFYYVYTVYTMYLFNIFIIITNYNYIQHYLIQYYINNIN